MGNSTGLMSRAAEPGDVGATSRAAVRSQAIRWDVVIAGAAIAAALTAVWLTLRADFLEHPGWLALQKADVILGPVLVGLYWLRRRPASRFGPVLIVAGFLSVPYILQSSPASWAFSAGVAWEGPISVVTVALILAFPTGRLDGLAERLILAVGVVGVIGLLLASLLPAPAIEASSAISGCSGPCPANAFLVSPDPALAGDLLDLCRIAVIGVALATIAVIVWRFATGTHPRRRALAVGAPVALVFLTSQTVYQTTRLLELETGDIETVIRWTVVVARSSLWYGFLLALVVAELFAGRVLRRVVEASLRRPTLREIEAMLREPLGDPGLRLAFWSSEHERWVGDDDDFAHLPAGRVLTAIERDGRPAVAIVHDAQLAEDPELVHAAGAVALLAQENAELELAWTDSLRELRDSRARIAAAGEIERRALERDLHDGAQQQFTAVLLKLGLVNELLPQGSIAQVRLSRLGLELEQALEALRRLAHGIYPVPLAETGLMGALDAVSKRSGGAIRIAGDGIGRYPPEVESAVYHCCLEAIQNATKHAGAAVGIAVALREAGAELRFEVRDDGTGFDPAAVHDGVGLRNMFDRLDALHGRLEVTASPGRGSVVAGAVPIR